MLDIKLLLEDPQHYESLLKRKDPEISLVVTLEIYKNYKEKNAALESAQAAMNQKAKQIGQMKQQGEEISATVEELSTLKARLGALKEEVSALEKSFNDLMSFLPNLPDPDLKVSMDPKDNEVVKEYGDKPSFPFEIKHHVEIATDLDLIDFERGAKVAGRGFPIYKGLGARLEWALLQFMIDYHIENGYEMHLLPHLAKPEALFHAAQLPKFEDQLFKIRDEDYHLYLIPTSEVVLNGMHSEEIFDPTSLPKKYVGFTPCFRREAGAHGKNERGLIRVHQFNKVEMFCFTKPEKSEEMLIEMRASAEMLLEKLGLHYRTTRLVSGDTSFVARKTYDIEVWLPGQDEYKEVSSVSNCWDFQARRSKTRFRNPDGKPEHVHTLNGSGLATSRVLVAILEQCQREDGRVEIPQVLQSYMGGLKTI